MSLSSSLLTAVLHLHRRFHHHRNRSRSRGMVLTEFRSGLPEIPLLSTEVALVFRGSLFLQIPLGRSLSKALIRIPSSSRPEHLLEVVLTTPLKIQVALLASIK